MPLIKPRKYKGRPVFNKAWALMSKKIHQQKLAQPLERRLQPWPNPLYYRPLPIQIEKATLKHEPSKRLRLLSRVKPSKYTEKYSPPAQPEHYVEQHNLDFVPTERLTELSQPLKKKKDLKWKRKMKKRREKMMVKWEEYEAARPAWLEKNSKPKKVPPPPPIPKLQRLTKPLSPVEREERLIILAQVPHRFLEKPSYMLFDPYKISQAAKKAKPTKRTIELAQHHELPEEAQLDLMFKPFTISKAALYYKASPRMKELAQPIVRRTAIDTDVREDAFTVPKRALKAKCSKRTKELARPIIRKDPD